MSSRSKCPECDATHGITKSQGRTSSVFHVHERTPAGQYNHFDSQWWMGKDLPEDPFEIENNGEGRTFDLSSGTLELTTDYGTTFANNFTSFQDTFFDDVFIGGAGDEIFQSYSGSDTISGGSGESGESAESVSVCQRPRCIVKNNTSDNFPGI